MTHMQHPVTRVHLGIAYTSTHALSLVCVVVMCGRAGQSHGMCMQRYTDPPTPKLVYQNNTHTLAACVSRSLAPTLPRSLPSRFSQHQQHARGEDRGGSTGALCALPSSSVAWLLGHGSWLRAHMPSPPVRNPKPETLTPKP
jgi:hypothetical protein